MADLSGVVPLSVPSFLSPDAPCRNLPQTSYKRRGPRGPESAQSGLGLGVLHEAGTEPQGACVQAFLRTGSSSEVARGERLGLRGHEAWLPRAATLTGWSGAQADSTCASCCS